MSNCTVIVLVSNNINDQIHSNYYYNNCYSNKRKSLSKSFNFSAFQGKILKKHLTIAFDDLLIIIFFFLLQTFSLFHRLPPYRYFNMYWHTL